MIAEAAKDAASESKQEDDEQSKKPFNPLEQDYIRLDLEFVKQYYLNNQRHFLRVKDFVAYQTVEFDEVTSQPITSEWKRAFVEAIGERDDPQVIKLKNGKKRSRVQNLDFTGLCLKSHCLDDERKGLLNGKTQHLAQKIQESQNQVINPQNQSYSLQGFISKQVRVAGKVELTHISSEKEGIETNISLIRDYSR